MGADSYLMGEAARRPITNSYTAVWFLIGAAYVLFDDVAGAQNLTYLAAHALGLSAMVVGIWVNRPRRPLPWVVLTIGHAVYLCADFLWVTSPPFPSAADALYISAYAIQIIGLATLVRRVTGGRDRAGLIDALAVTAGVAVLSWVFLMSPLWAQAGLSRPAQAVSLAYPMMDMLLVGVVVRLALLRTARKPAYWLLGLGFLGQLAADTVYTTALLNGSFYLGHPLEIGWMIGFYLSGAAMLHPSMTFVDNPPIEEPIPSRARLAVLGAAALIPSIALIVQGARAETRDVAVIAAISGVLYLLVLSRVGHLMSDLTHRRKIERALRDAEAKYRRLVEQTPGVPYVYDEAKSSRAVYIGPQVESITGFSPEDWMTGSDMWYQRMHPEDRDRVLAIDEETNRTGAPFMAEYRLKARDGRTVWVHDEAVVMSDQAEGSRTWQGLMVDITEQKAIEARLQRSQKMEAVGQLAGGIAHDFNNLLAVVENYAGFLLEDYALNDPRRADVDEILTASKRAGSLVRRLLTFSRRETIEPVVVDINETVSDMEELLRRTLGENVRLEVSTEAELPNVRIDRSQLDQVIVNLAVNARDAMLEGGTLTIGTSAVSENGGGDRVVLEFSDTGRGMSREVQEHMFEPFFTTKPAGQGTGLGLATVYGVVHQAGGRIEVNSRPGRGTRFKIFLPATLESRPESRGETTLVAAHGNGRRVLVAEDEDAVGRMIERILSRGGYEVIRTASAEEALDEFARLDGSIDLLLTDIVMSGMPGTELAARLQAMAPGLGVIYMSGYNDEMIARHGMTDAAAVYLQKPFDAQKLLGAIERTAGAVTGAADLS